MCRLTVFCQQERQFLESNFTLCKFSEFFQLKELFSTMEKNQAQEEATKILQSLDTENDKIICNGGCALQAKQSLNRL